MTKLAALAGILVIVIGCASGGVFRGSTPAQEAECRNIWRMVANTCYHGTGWGEALGCRSQGAEAYDDCMRSKGLVEVEQ